MYYSVLIAPEKLIELKMKKNVINKSELAGP